MDSVTEELWRRHRHEPGQAVRDALVHRYERLVRMIAAKAFSRRFSAELEFGDYLQFGMLGLLESIDRFRVEEGVRFETFAGRRVVGAILTGVESLSEKQRQIASRQKILRDRAASLHASTPGLQCDVLARLGDTAIGLALGLLLEDTGLYAGVEQQCVDNSYAPVELRQLQKKVREAVATLPDSERVVVMRHYFQLHTLEEIALDLDVSGARVSQLHRSGLSRLRWRL